MQNFKFKKGSRDCNKKERKQVATQLEPVRNTDYNPSACKAQPNTCTNKIFLTTSTPFNPYFGLCCFLSFCCDTYFLFQFKILHTHILYTYLIFCQNFVLHIVFCFHCLCTYNKLRLTQHFSQHLTIIKIFLDVSHQNTTILQNVINPCQQCLRIQKSNLHMYSNLNYIYVCVLADQVYFITTHVCS